MTPSRLTEVALTAFYRRALSLEPAERSPGRSLFVLGELVLRIQAAALAAAGLGVDGPRDLPWARSA